MAQHKWHKEIKAWADGAEIESRVFHVSINKWSSWSYEEKPQWYDNEIFEYRIIEQPKEPQYLYVTRLIGSNDCVFLEHKPTNLTNKYTYIGKIKLEND